MYIVRDNAPEIGSACPRCTVPVCARGHQKQCAHGYTRGCKFLNLRCTGEGFTTEKTVNGGRSWCASGSSPDPHEAQSAHGDLHE